MPSTLQESGRTCLAEMIKAQPLHIAWGEGLASWDTEPESEPSNAVALVAEVGRRTVSLVDFVIPDLMGGIELPSGERYALSATPTPWLYVRTVYDYLDANGHTIREFALCVGTQLQAGLPAGQRYFTPDQVVNPGRMYLLNRDERVVRTGSTFHSIEIVLPF